MLLGSWKPFSTCYPFQGNTIKNKLANVAIAAWDNLSDGVGVETWFSDKVDFTLFLLPVCEPVKNEQTIYNQFINN